MPAGVELEDAGLGAVGKKVVVVVVAAVAVVVAPDNHHSGTVHW